MSRSMESLDDIDPDGRKGAAKKAGRPKRGANQTYNPKQASQPPPKPVKIPQRGKKTQQKTMNTQKTKANLSMIRTTLTPKPKLRPGPPPAVLQLKTQ